MLKSFIRKKLTAEEKHLGVSLDYLRHILDTSLGAFWRFTKFIPLANYRKTLPADAYHVARLVAAQDADCGTCVQIEVNLSKQDGVSPHIIKATLDGNFEELPQELVDVYQFTKSVVMAGDDNDALREVLRKRYGEPAFVELALAIAACRVFPTTKRALGYAKSCSLVTVDV